ncbi:MAG: CHASE2 domain-containing protein [Elainellaceae cyanobacterium]
MVLPTLRTAFELKIWHRDEDQTCFFLLLWDNRQRQISARLPYPRELQIRYQRWQRRYFRYYRFPVTQAVQTSGRLNPSSGDPCHDLLEAEQSLIQAFHHWLDTGSVRKIRQQIRDELSRIAQRASAQGLGLGEASIDVFLACDSPEIMRFPWEAWDLAPDGSLIGAVRIIRTVMDAATIQPVLQPRASYHKPRVLAILSTDPNLSVQNDWQTLRSLSSVASVEQVTWDSKASVTAVKATISAAIQDSRGWDVLFFAGHSDETATTGGRVAIAPNLYLSMQDLAAPLRRARELGLQLAIFNSCSGLSIATNLTCFGLQVVVMREAIANDVAHQFLNDLCQQLARHASIYEAVQTACHRLRSAAFTYPSADLLPSFFSPVYETPYQINPVHWKHRLRGWWPLRQWYPTQREAIAFVAILLLSLMYPVQDWGLSWRILLQSHYRSLTRQLPATKTPPVLLVAIDQNSLDQKQPDGRSLSAWPIDRIYLASLIDRLISLNAQVIGIDYYLDNQQPGEDALIQSIQRAVETNQTWFIFAISKSQNWLVREAIANLNWSLQGDTQFFEWFLQRPNDPTCVEYCPFAYQLALAHLLNQQSHLPNGVPSSKLENQSDFQMEVSRYLREHDQSPQGSPIAAIMQRRSWGLDTIIDFSIPPDHIYTYLPAWKLLSLSPSNAQVQRQLQQQLQQQVVIIAPGGYDQAEDNFSIPKAVAYWCRGRPLFRPNQDCPTVFTGGETHAYMMHHWLSSHQVVRIPDWWVICLAALLGKGVVLVVINQSLRHQRRAIIILAGTTVISGLVVLQVHVSALVVIPWLFPTVTFWIYMLPAVRKLLP